MEFNDKEYEKFININITEECLENYEKQYLEGKISFPDFCLKISFQYSLGLHYADLFKERVLLGGELYKGIWRTDEKYNKSIFWYLTAINEFSNYNTSEDELVLLKKIYVNLGNEYMLQLRYFEAIESYDEALKIDSNFSMAIANRLYAIEKLTLMKQCVDNGKLFNYFLTNYIAFDANKMENGSEQFKKKQEYYKNLKQKYAKLYMNNKLCFNPENKFEICKAGNNYTDFIHRNRLILNPASCLGNYSEGMNDSLLLLDKNCKWYTDLESLQKEFRFLREKLFLNATLKTTNSSEEISLTFKGFYSLFDKAAFFIYRYFDLDLSEDKVYYNNVWDAKTKDGYKLLDIRSTHLYSLYWINKEYKTVRAGASYKDLFSPEGQKLYELRNVLEHRISSRNFQDNLLLVMKTIKLASVIRNVLLYLNLLIYDESNPALYENDKRRLDLVYLPLDDGMWNLFK